MTPDELKVHLDTINAEIQANLLKRDEQIKATGQANTEVKSALDNLAKQVEQIRGEMLATSQRTAPAAGEMKSLGERFVESGAFNQFKARAWHRGGASMQIDGPLLERKTTITSSAVGSSTPGILVPERLPGIVRHPQRKLRVRDLIPWTTTQSNAVEFVKVNAFTNAASPQTEGNAKAESALTYVIAYANVQTIAHWIPATRQVLDDFAALGASIDAELLSGLADIEDYELLRGDGTGVHISGLITEATAYAGTYDAASDTRLDKLNHAIAELEANKYTADGWVLNPVDVRIIQVIKNNEGGANTGAYVFGGPGAAVPLTIWGLPVAVTPEMQVGKFLVGDFSTYTQGYDRMQSRIDVSTEHSDYFTKNMVAVRAEERIALAVKRGTAFRYGSF